MGYDVSACAAFGIVLREHQAKIRKVYDEFNKAHKPTEEGEDGYVNDEQDWERNDRVAEEFGDKIIAAFRAKGIKVPMGASLFYTGTDDERPGRTETDSDEWVLGFGLLTRPQEYPKMHESFLKIAQWHTWVVGG